MYDMQIISYDTNLSFFIDEFIIYMIIQHTKPLSMYFLLQIWKYVGFYDSQSDPTIYDSTYFQWFYIRSWFWQTCLDPWFSILYKNLYLWSDNHTKEAPCALVQILTFNTLGCQLIAYLLKGHTC